MFVRTESEIEDLRDYFVEKELNGHPYVHKQNAWCIYRESILKKSKNVKDLCDEFVIVYKNEYNSHIVYSDLDWALDKASRSNTEHEIYGCIWTKWGLRFVAKYDYKLKKLVLK